MKNRRGIAWLFALFAVLSLVASACGSDEKTSEKDKTTTTKAGDGGKSTTTAAKDTGAMAELSGTLNGQGSSFQDTFEQQVSADFKTEVADAGGSGEVTYTKTGSSDGKKALGDKSVDFAGSDSPLKDEELSAFGDRKILYFPIVAGPIALPYNLEGVDELNLSPEVISGIFQAEITAWDDEAIAADNPDAELPSTPITVVHRSDGSGTTKNFTKWLTVAAKDSWKLDTGEEVEWDSKTQGAEKSTGVTSVVASTDGAIGYADLADAAKEDLPVAAIGNSSGDFVVPTPGSASAAIEAAAIEDDLTYDPLNADAEGAYPITSPTWILVDAKQDDAAKADLIKAYLTYVLTTGQDAAENLLYAPLPEDLAKKAMDQIEEISA